MADSLRRTFLEYCSSTSKEHISVLQIESEEDSVVEQLHILRLRLQRCHSAYECAKAFPDVGPLLATLAQSQVVARSAGISRAVVDTAIEYSKATCQTVYSNQKAIIWFSQLIKSLVSMNPPADSVVTAGQHRIETSELVGRRYVLQQMASDLQSNPSSDGQMWANLFSICYRNRMPELLADLVPAMDTCAWSQLENHELVSKYGLEILLILPIEQSLRMWLRIPRLRALTIVYLLRGQDNDSKMREFVRAMMDQSSMAKQLWQDIFGLLQTTKDPRIVSVWRQLCQTHLDAVKRHGSTTFAADQDGPDVNVVDIFTQSPPPTTASLLKQQWKCVITIRHNDNPQHLLQTWLMAVAVVASDNYPFQLLSQYFCDRQGSCSAKVLSAQQMIEREMALEVAGFLWAPLVQGTRSKDLVVAVWLQSRNKQQ